ncbi:hypothetical protein VFPPC_13245 [Pochonia chlamydosporia 170]|uniref:Uncharacterized protein n=1 Tax=Pochonia chlamydosporia 170 TaxID=1380566 RepID=A0A179FXL8_METCM|nr:hypothetical protein VFPPC_13245 [Pochonia chlamydosporia 170]OAQ69719.1 hypothetical protein VFPPC_13245 [Pochonia chlamydosporia 170]
MDTWGDCPLCMHHGAYPLKSRYYRQSQLHEGPWGYQFQAQGGGHFAHHDHFHDHHHEILHGHGGGIFPVRPRSLGYLPVETPFLVHVKDHPANARGTGRGYYYDVSLTRDLSATDIISFLTTNPTRFKVMFKNPQGDFEELTPDMDTRELVQHMTKFDIMLREHVHTAPVFAITPEHALSYPRALHP